MNSGCGGAAAAAAACAPARVTFKSTHKWPHAEAEFVRCLSSRERNGVHGHEGQQRGQHHAHHHGMGRAVVVDTYACRQMFLRSYTFSRKETVPQKTRRCLHRVRSSISRRSSTSSSGESESGSGSGSGSGCGGAVCKMGRSVASGYKRAMRTLFRRLLSCTSTVDVDVHVTT